VATVRLVECRTWPDCSTFKRQSAGRFSSRPSDDLLKLLVRRILELFETAAFVAALLPHKAAPFGIRPDGAFAVVFRGHRTRTMEMPTIKETFLYL